MGPEFFHELFITREMRRATCAVVAGLLPAAMGFQAAVGSLAPSAAGARPCPRFHGLLGSAENRIRVAPGGARCACARPGAWRSLTGVRVRCRPGVPAAACSLGGAVIPARSSLSPPDVSAALRGERGNGRLACGHGRRSRYPATATPARTLPRRAGGVCREFRAALPARP